jgi:hypothetical protein
MQRTQFILLRSPGCVCACDEGVVLGDLAARLQADENQAVLMEALLSWPSRPTRGTIRGEAIGDRSASAGSLRCQSPARNWYPQTGHVACPMSTGCP